VLARPSSNGIFSEGKAFGSGEGKEMKSGEWREVEQGLKPRLVQIIFNNSVRTSNTYP
jgi:hypothetical protein